DPAIERWNDMRETAFYRWRWTPRYARQAVIGLIVVPAAIFYVSATNDWDFVGKRKGQPLARGAAPEASE
ncbi:hypothetical protein WOLCODRAFT_64987, partial [Wolfiporia cocos MD-104 SS10]